jgi:hypothetical protein
MQIAQMVGGTVVTVMSGYWWYTRGTDTEGKAVCAVDPANFKMGFGMYLSYFILFAVLFYDKYIAPKRKAADEVIEKICGVDVTTGADGAGFFHVKTKEVGDRSKME